MKNLALVFSALFGFSVFSVGTAWAVCAGGEPAEICECTGKSYCPSAGAKCDCPPDYSGDPCLTGPLSCSKGTKCFKDKCVSSGVTLLEGPYCTLGAGGKSINIFKTCTPPVNQCNISDANSCIKGGKHFDGDDGVVRAYQGRKDMKSRATSGANSAYVTPGAVLRPGAPAAATTTPKEVNNEPACPKRDIRTGRTTYCP